MRRGSEQTYFFVEQLVQLGDLALDLFPLLVQLKQRVLQVCHTAAAAAAAAALPSPRTFSFLLATDAHDEEEGDGERGKRGKMKRGRTKSLPLPTFTLSMALLMYHLHYTILSQHQHNYSPFVVWMMSSLFTIVSQKLAMKKLCKNNSPNIYKRMHRCKISLLHFQNVVKKLPGRSIKFFRSKI